MEELMRQDWGQSVVRSMAWRNEEVCEAICIGDDATLSLHPRETAELLAGLQKHGLLTDLPGFDQSVPVMVCGGDSPLELTVHIHGGQACWQYQMCEPDGWRSAKGEICFLSKDGYLLTIARLFLFLDTGLPVICDLARQFEEAPSVRQLCRRDRECTARFITRALKMAA